MSPGFRFITALAVAAVALAAPADLWAQAGDPQPASVRRPYRGLFGGPSDSSTPQSLVVTGSVYGAYDDNVLEGLSEGQAPNSWLQQSGTYWGANAGIDYALSKPGERFSFGGTEHRAAPVPGSGRVLGCFALFHRRASHGRTADEDRPHSASARVHRTHPTTPTSSRRSGRGRLRPGLHRRPESG